MSRATTKILLFASAAAAFAATTGCRLPEEEEFDPPDGGFDAGADDAGPGALCPEGTPDLFNNAYNPYKYGDVAVDLEVVDFSFFKCPHCAEFAFEWEEAWANNPEFRDRVRVYYHHFPFSYASAFEVHAASVAAANQGMDAFWQLHDYIYNGLYTYSTQYGIEEIRAYCEDVLGLEMTQFEDDLVSTETYAFLNWDKEQAEAVGVGGTPSVFVCGEKISWTHLEEIVAGYLGE
jgi:protein-disulfide isomerase